MWLPFVSLVEAACLAVYVVDCVVKIVAVGLGNFFMCDNYRQPWDHFRVLVVRRHRARSPLAPRVCGGDVPLFFADRAAGGRLDICVCRRLALAAVPVSATTHVHLLRA